MVDGSVDHDFHAFVKAHPKRQAANPGDINAQTTFDDCTCKRRISLHRSSQEGAEGSMLVGCVCCQ